MIKQKAFQVSEEEFELLVKASKLMGLNSAGFIRSSAIEKARKILRENQLDLIKN